MNYSNPCEEIKKKYLAEVFGRYEKYKRNPYYYLDIVQKFADEISVYKNDKEPFLKDFFEFVMDTRKVTSILSDSDDLKYLDVFGNYLEHIQGISWELTNIQKEKSDSYKSRASRIIKELAVMYVSLNAVYDEISSDLPILAIDFPKPEETSTFSEFA